MTTTPLAPRLPWWTLLAYAAPKMPLAALYFPVFLYLPEFYADQRGLSLESIGVAFVAARLLDAVSDPVMGWLSDTLKTRFGRRKPWLLLSTPLVCLSVWMAMVPPAEVEIGYLVAWLTALTLSWTIAITPYDAWGGEISPDYAERARVTVWREAAFLLGTLVAAILYASDPSAEIGLQRVAIAVLIGLPLAAGLALWLAPEPRDRSRPREAMSREGWRAIVENKPFARLLTAYVINGAANAFPAVLFLFFATRVLGADDQTAGLLLVAYLLAAVLTAPFWSFAARRLSKHRAWCWAMLYAAAVFSVVPFLSEGDLTAFLIVSILTGCAFGADAALPPAMQADVVDVDTARSGAQRTGLYFAFWSVATKAASGVAGGIGLWALGAAGFQETGENTPEALLALTLLYAVAPIVLKIIAVALMWRFPLDEAEQMRLRERIEAAA